MAKTKKASKKFTNKRTSPFSVKRNGFSRKMAIIFVLVFAGIGTYLLVNSLAYRNVGISNGSIYAFCPFSHRSNDDPIVFPNRTGAAHSHDFFGATSLNAFSTNTSIRQGGTTCHRQEDKSAYWIPTMYYNDQAISPTCTDLHNPMCFRITAVYGNDHQILKYMQPFPAGLKVIAGTSSGGSQFTPNRNEPIWIWLCRNSTVVAPGDANTAPTCSDSTDEARFPQYLQLRILFPSCWDGKNLDSPDHKSHMAYAYQQGTGTPANRCPSTHPVQLPTLDLDIGYYGVKGGPAARLSSGNMSTVHADFMNGWDQNFFTNMMNMCLKRDVYCGGGNSPAVNHNNEPEDVDDAEVQRYLSSPAYRQYALQAEKAYPQAPAPSAPAVSQAKPSSPTKQKPSAGGTGGVNSGVASTSASGAAIAENSHSVESGLHQTAAAKVYTISVKVLDQNRKPVKGAKVTLDKRVAISDHDGIASFSDVAPGEVDIKAEAHGSRTINQIEIVDTGTPVDIQSYTVSVKDMRKATYAAAVMGILVTGLLMYRLGIFSWAANRLGK